MQVGSKTEFEFKSNKHEHVEYYFAQVRVPCLIGYEYWYENTTI